MQTLVHFHYAEALGENTVGRLHVEGQRKAQEGQIMSQSCLSVPLLSAKTFWGIWDSTNQGLVSSLSLQEVPAHRFFGRQRNHLQPTPWKIWLCPRQSKPVTLPFSLRFEWKLNNFPRDQLDFSFWVFVTLLHHLSTLFFSSLPSQQRPLWSAVT